MDLHPYFYISRALPTRKSGLSVMSSLGHSGDPEGWGYPSKTLSPQACSCASGVGVSQAFSAHLENTRGARPEDSASGLIKAYTFHGTKNRVAEDAEVRKAGIPSVLTSKLSSTNKTTTSYRKKSLDVLMNEGGNILPVQNISQPAVLTTHMHLVPFVPSRVCHVLWNKTSDMGNSHFNTSKG